MWAMHKLDQSNIRGDQLDYLIGERDILVSKDQRIKRSSRRIQPHQRKLGASILSFANRSKSQLRQDISPTACIKPHGGGRDKVVRREMTVVRPAKESNFYFLHAVAP